MTEALAEWETKPGATQVERVLQILRVAGEYGVLSSRFLELHLPRAAARVRELKDAGWEISSEREGGFCRYVLIGRRAEDRGEPSMRWSGAADAALSSASGEENKPLVGLSAGGRDKPGKDAFLRPPDVETSAEPGENKPLVGVGGAGETGRRVAQRDSHAPDSGEEPATLFTLPSQNTSAFTGDAEWEAA